MDTLKGDEKFFCNTCGAYQEAQKRTRLSALPDVLLLHLNRFKYTTHMDRCAFSSRCKMKTEKMKNEI